MIPDWALFAVVVAGPVLWLAGSMLADLWRWQLEHRAWRRLDDRRAAVARALGGRR